MFLSCGPEGPAPICDDSLVRFRSAANTPFPQPRTPTKSDQSWNRRTKDSCGPPTSSHLHILHPLGLLFDPFCLNGLLPFFSVLCFSASGVWAERTQGMFGVTHIERWSRPGRGPIFQARGSIRILSVLTGLACQDRLGNAHKKVSLCFSKRGGGDMGRHPSLGEVRRYRARSALGSGASGGGLRDAAHLHDTKHGIFRSSGRWLECLSKSAGKPTAGQTGAYGFRRCRTFAMTWTSSSNGKMQRCRCRCLRMSTTKHAMTARPVPNSFWYLHRSAAVSVHVALGTAGGTAGL